MIENKRLQKLANALNVNEVAFIYSGDIMYKTLDQNFPFEVDKNFYYLTGLEEPYSGLLVHKKAGKVDIVLFKPITDPKVAIWDGEYLTKEEAGKRAKIDTVYGNDVMLTYLLSTVEENAVKKIYIADYKSYYTYPIYDKIKEKALPIDVEVGSIIPELTKMRLIKDEEEIKNLQKAIDITNQGLYKVLDNLKSMKSEYEAQAVFEQEVYKNNTDLAFTTISANGQNATTLHYVDNNAQFEKNTMNLFDLGARYKYYCADISRTYPINGKYSKRQKEYYNLVLDTNKKCIDMVKPGVNYSDIIRFARINLAEGLFKMGKIKIDQKILNDPSKVAEKEEILLKEVSKYYFHAVGHPLGLDVHDLGTKDIILQPGMVFTIEPGLYIKDESIGIRLEDDILVTEKGNRCLSQKILKEVKDIENYLNK